MAISDYIELVQGEDKTITLMFKMSGEPFDMTGTTEIEARFPGANEPVSKKLSQSGVSVINAAGGKVAVTLDDQDTLLLKVGERQSFEVLVDNGPTRRIFQFERNLTVNKRIVP